MGPYHHAAFKKKPMTQYQENFRMEDRRTEGWKDGQTRIHRTLLAMTGGLVKAPPYSEFQFKKYIYICFIYFIAFLVKSFLKETKM